MNTIQFVGALELGLIYSFVSIGVFLSFRVLKFSDLTVDGSFPLGAAVSAVLVTRGTSPWLAIGVAAVAGGASGWITAFLSTRLKMLHLLAGILTMSALYSINLRILGNRPNLSLLGDLTVFSGVNPIWVLVTALGLLSAIIIWFLSTQIGLAIRATGCNARMASACGVQEERMIAYGLALSNACVAIGGALFTQLFGFADVSLGLGTIIIGLASVMMGEALMPTRTVAQAIGACVMGTVFYRVLIALALNLGHLGIQASDLNLITAILVIVSMNFSRIKKSILSQLNVKRDGQI